MKWKNKGHEFDDLAQIIIDSAQTKSFYIWGAGYFGDAIFETLNCEIDIIGYIDSNPAKQGKKMNNLEIFQPSVLDEAGAEKKISVLVSAGWTKDIFTSLAHHGFIKDVHCFHIDEFLAIYMMYRHNKLCLASCSYNISEFCTLCCDKCVAFNPLIRDKTYPGLDKITADFEIFFNSVDYLSSLYLTGGDPMCNPHISEILEYLGSNYIKKRIGTINLMTNAVIVPDDEFLSLLKKYDIYFRFTDYSLNGIQKIDVCMEKLQKHEIRYDHVQFTEWYDLGYPQESNGIVGDDKLHEFFTACDIRSCSTIVDGYYYLCGRIYSADRIGYCAIEDTDRFDLKNLDSGKKKEFLEYSLGYSDKGFYNYCRKCNGGFNVNLSRVTPGKQIVKGHRT